MGSRLASIMFLTFVLLSPQIGFCQQKEEPIKLINPSFEDLPKAGEPPRGWYDCGAPEESPPDVQPSFFKVNKVAQDGQTYMGMVVRDNDTWEGVGQRLSRPLEGGKCYIFTMQISRSELYISPSKAGKEVNYTTPARVRIWGGGGYCNKKELLSETIEVKNTTWQEYRFELNPRQECSYILIEAFFKTPTLFPYNGNVLVDNASAIMPISCIGEKVAATKPIKKVDTKPTNPKKNTSTSSPDSNKITTNSKPNDTTPTPRPHLSTELSTKVRAGQIIRIDELYFDSDTTTISKNSYPALDEVFKFLQSNPEVQVEVGGHTNNIPEDSYCDRLSTARAKVVVDYLVNKGVSSSRLKYKGYGKRKPVAPNSTVQGRKKNQRVEIKILSTDG